MSNVSVVCLLDKYRDGYEERARVFIEGFKKYGLPEAEARKHIEQIISPGEEITEIPSLDISKNHTASKQLKERFLYAGSWKDIGEHLLSIKQISSLIRKKKFRQWILSMRENWENSAPWLFSDERLSVLSVSNEDDGDFSLLVWTKDNTEPEVWRYSGQNEHKFENLLAWLRWLNGE